MRWPAAYALRDSMRLEHLYIHVPFCTHICPYCAFYKHKNDLPSMKAFIPALKKEWAWAQRNFVLQPRTIYFGGGTPSALSVSQLENLFEDWPWRSVEEFTFECNPATISPEKARLLKQIGVNRISLGAQSFHPESLKLLGRTHNAEQVRKTISILRETGFLNINIDLMFALPGQTFEQWAGDLQLAVECEPNHLSCYNLNFEEDTAFFEKLQAGVWKTDDTLQRDCFLHTVDFLKENGIEMYEISNFAQPGFESIHNRAYWQGKDYLGFGPSACSTIGLERWQNTSNTLLYSASIEQNGFSTREKEPLSEQTRNQEKIFLGLRTKWGVPCEITHPWQSQINSLIDENLAHIENSFLKLTPEGLLVADSISEMFMENPSENCCRE